MEIALLKTRFGDGGLFGARRHASDRNFRPLMGVNRVRATREQPPGEPTLHRNRAGRENGFPADGFDLACGLDLRIFQRGPLLSCPAPCRSGWQARQKVAATKDAARQARQG